MHICRWWLHGSSKVRRTQTDGLFSVYILAKHNISSVGILFLVFPEH